MSIYAPIKKPIFLPNAASWGDRVARAGTIVTYTEGDRSRIGRVLGLATHGGMGPMPRGTLAVLALSDDHRSAYMRLVSPADVMHATMPDGFGATMLFVLFGEPPDPNEADRAVQYGSMGDNYVTRYLAGDRLQFNAFRDAEIAARAKGEE